MTPGSIRLQVAPATLNRTSSRSAGRSQGRRSRHAPARAPLTASWGGGYQRYIRTLNFNYEPVDSTVCQRELQLLQVKQLPGISSESFC